jgi:hypothetical protein
MRLLWLSLLILGPVIQAAVLAIDYGTEFTKLSLVKPGVPFDVILDRDSKRKISSVVGWKREDRVFGAEGKMSVSDLVYIEVELMIVDKIPRSSFPLCQAFTRGSICTSFLRFALPKYTYYR